MVIAEDDAIFPKHQKQLANLISQKSGDQFLLLGVES